MPNKNSAHNTPSQGSLHSNTLDVQIDSLLKRAHQMQATHPDELQKIQKLRKEVEEIESSVNLTQTQNNKLALIRLYLSNFHEYLHIQHQIHQLDSEILHTEPTPHNPIYFSQLTLRLKELYSKGVKKEAELASSLVELKKHSEKSS